MDFGRTMGLGGERALLAGFAGAARTIIQVAFARLPPRGSANKMQLAVLLPFGREFHQRVEAIEEAFSAMQEQIQKERRAWNASGTSVKSNRASHHQHLGMYGDIGADRRRMPKSGS
jgi:hypothetical protein